MSSSGHRFSRPVYESLPWLYITAGLAGLLASYLLASHGVLSLIVGVLGLLVLLGGIVVLLRRRDYRAMRAQYGNSDSLGGEDQP
jgi:ABC-type xylose transport system permease subunit